MRTYSTVIWSAVLAILLIGSGGCGGPVERKAKYRERAEQHMAERNYPKARVALRNLLRIDPNDIDAHFLFAQIEEKEKNWPNAVANYERVIELAPSHKGARIKLAKYYLEVGAVDKVEEAAGAVLKLSPQDVDALAVRAAVLAINGQETEAERQARALVHASPSAVDPGVLLATLLSRRGAHAEAEVVLRGLLRHHPEDLELLGILATSLRDAGAFSSAEEVYRHIISLEPWVYDHQLKLALLHDKQGHLDEAERVLREAVRLEPKSERRHLTLVDFLATRRGPTHGEQALTEAQDALPSSVTIQLARGQLYQRTDQRTKARAVYQQVAETQKSKPAGLEAMVRMAALDVLDGHADVATGRIQEVLRENPRAIEALLLQGQIALIKHEGRTAINAFRTVIKDQPDHAEGHLLLGEAYLLTHESNLAREMLEKAAALNPGLLRAHRSLAALDVQDHHLAEATRRLETVLSQAPGDAESLDQLLSIAVAQEDWAGADALIARIRLARPEHYLTDMTEGFVHEARHRYGEATTAYERANSRNPSVPDPLVALIKAETALGRGMTSRTRLESLLKQQPDHAYGHGLLGELLIAEHAIAEGDAHLRQATSLKPEWSPPWVALATSQLANRRAAEAMATIREGISKTRGSLDLRMMQAAVQTQLGQIDQAIHVYEDILREQPRTLLAANNLAALLTERKGDAVSLERALAVSKDFERAATNPILLDTLGTVHLKMGHHQEAVRLLTQAVGHAPNHPLLNYHLGLAYYGVGDRGAARKYLAAAVAGHQDFDERDKAQALLAQLGA